MFPLSVRILSVERNELFKFYAHGHINISLVTNKLDKEKHYFCNISLIKGQLRSRNTCKN